jgi:hypothetical protein
MFQATHRAPTGPIAGSPSTRPHGPVTRSR